MPGWKSLHRVATALHLADDTWAEERGNIGPGELTLDGTPHAPDVPGDVGPDTRVPAAGAATTAGTTGGAGPGGVPAGVEASPGGDDGAHHAPEADDDLTGPAPRRDVAHALLLMLSPRAAMRIDGIGLARQALDHRRTGDARRDLTDDERGLVAGARAWCMAVHSDLAIGTIDGDPILLAEAERHAVEAYQLRPQDPQVVATLALVRHRQGRHADAVAWAEWAVTWIGQHPDLQVDGRLAATLATTLLVLALARWRLNDSLVAAELVEAAGAWRDTLELDDVAFAALAAETDHIPSTASAGTAPVDGPSAGPVGGTGPVDGPAAGHDGDEPTGPPTGAVGGRTGGTHVTGHGRPVMTIHSERPPTRVPA